ncbi:MULTISPECIES: serine hydrolase domain-containing protein [Halorussus]|uniref:serine hydrolase domain-containing protein n=1 Tax=Halorussus TaxID=1070314 RepID=UPI00209E51A0|nr:serine hydrolase domain-containing protein [Halorussus vallis]USZ76727.1 beta-lactamase family protein [Halorussus vallis]
MTRRLRVATVGAVLLLVLLAQVGPTLAGGPTVEARPSGNETPAQQTPGVDSVAEVEAFVDAQMAQDLREHRVSGATISVVKDGELLFAEGYGYADRANRTPVVANRTLFRIGSVSKLFVWTAAMQQIQRGNIDPDADVNRYLDDVHIPRTYGEPVTMEHLATHTPGFEDRLAGVAVESPADVKPLGEALEDPPARVRPPGVVTSYSNYGAALAGHVVARRANTTFDRYIERRIFRPLEMRHSTFEQPVPSAVPGTLSKGYSYRNGRFVAEEFEAVGIPPAGSMSATATDVAKFMTAHLQGGRYGDSRILSESAARRMHRQHFANHPALNGVAFGFYEESTNGVRIIGHGGDTTQFHSGLWLFPERDLGVFVSYNSVGGAAARQDFFENFTDRFFPADGTASPPPVEGDAAAANTIAPNAAADGGQAGPPLSAFAGTYRTTRIPYTTFEKVVVLNRDVSVRAAGNGTLVAETPLGESRRFRRVAPTVFQAVDGDARIAFRVEDGRGSYLFFDAVPVQSFERVAWWESTQVQFALLGGAALLLLTGILGWPVLAARRAWHGGPPPADGPRAARWLSGTAGLVGLGFVVGFGALLATDPTSVLFRSAVVEALFVAPAVAAAMAVGAVVFAALAWKNRYWGLVGRLHYTLLAVVLVVLCWQLSYWNLLGAAF